MEQLWEDQVREGGRNGSMISWRRGELPPTKGTASGNPTAPTTPHTSQAREQEQLSSTEEQEQLSSTREPASPPTAIPVREQDLRQLEITTFLEPAASKLDWPTVQDLADRMAPDPPATRISSGGSPRESEQLGLLDGGKDDESFGGNGGAAYTGNTNTGMIVGGDTDGRLGDECEMNVPQEEECEMNVRNTAPSVGDTRQLSSGRKPDTVSVLALCGETDQPGKEVDSVRHKCEFRRGGKCITHGIVGTKYVEKSRVWSQRKDGTFGWKPKSTTKYVCQFSEVAKSDECKYGMNGRLEGVAKTNLVSAGIGMDMNSDQNTALGGPHSDTGDNVSEG